MSLSEYHDIDCCTYVRNNISGSEYNLTIQTMLLSHNICVLVRNLFMENRIINVIKVTEGVCRHMSILVAEIAAAPNRMRKSSRSKQRSPVYQSL